CILGPSEALGFPIVFFQVSVDRRNQFVDAAKASAPNPSPRNLAKPSFDQVQPRTARRGEMQMKAPVTLEPALHLRSLVRAVVVHDQMQVEILPGLAV